MQETLLQDVVNLARGGVMVGQDSLGDIDVLLHAVESLVLAIVEGMVDEGAGFLGLAHRGADDVDDGGAFGVGTSDGVDGGELTYAKGSDNGSDS